MSGEKPVEEWSTQDVIDYVKAQQGRDIPWDMGMRLVFALEELRAVSSEVLVETIVAGLVYSGTSLPPQECAARARQLFNAVKHNK